MNDARFLELIDAYSSDAIEAFSTSAIRDILLQLTIAFLISTMVNNYVRAFITISIFLLNLCVSDNIEDLYDFDNGAWVICRKMIEGVNGNFGVGYTFTVTYELLNIGTQKASNIKIQDSWDTEFFKPYTKIVTLIQSMSLS